MSEQRRVAIFIDSENSGEIIFRDGEIALIKQLKKAGHKVVDASVYGRFQTDYKINKITQFGYRLYQVEENSLHNAADIRMAVDIITLAFRCPEITDFMIITKDMDFIPVFRKLMAMGKCVTVPLAYFNDISDIVDIDRQLIDFSDKTRFRVNGIKKEKEILSLLEAEEVTANIIKSSKQPLSWQMIKARLDKVGCFHHRLHGKRNFVDFLNGIDGVLVDEDGFCMFCEKIKK